VRHWRTTGGIAAAVLIVSTVAVATTVMGARVEQPVGLLPDIVEEVPHHLQIQNTQQGEFLRFSTTHVNIGKGPLQIRGGDQVAPCVIEGVSYVQCTHAVQEILDANGKVVSTQAAGVALFHPEHNHWHQDAVAAFTIVDENGDTEATGTKVTFCLVDVKHYGDTGTFKKDYPRTYFECNGDLQGIAPGWGDQYHHSTPGQELEITGFAAGTYLLEHDADPENRWLESNERNNHTWVRFELERNGANASVTVLATSDCIPDITCGFGGNP
jgi:Lysyl oxidase